MEILKGESLKKYFGEVKAVDGVTISFEKGSTVSIVGPNGAGKTTLLNLFTGHFKPTSGKIYFEGKDVTALSPNKRSKLGMGRAFQLVNLFEDFTVSDNIKISIASVLGKTGRFFSFFDRDKELNSMTEEVLSLFNLSEKANFKAKDLSHGERKLLDVAIATSLNPRLLFLDEPTSGVSTADKTPIMEMLKAVIKKKGLTVIMVEHDLGVVFNYSDRVVVMHEGKVLADGEPESLKTDIKVLEVLVGGKL
ncbi:MAG: ABC transporter ATP-binding protein [Aigarchaeota archaeon]|nr:ABC transporter ATP-binding protein [Aigarchaeota archaeon]MDW8092068.1 ABC transporter ATP-binding protein [Nitrososphaerota archaeon]